MNLDAPIKGWGQHELADMLGAEIGDDLSEESMLPVFRALGALWNEFHPCVDEISPEAEEAVAWIRRWLEKLAEVCPGYLAPLFLGIATIEDDQTLVHVVEVNLYLLWT